ncbi:MAG TPA: sulfurtransferase TusE [Candidatus Moranbacteria bacterium]|nr:sulfurtransferase TusE [Candidatus Moranbacteria bacterium]
MELEFEGRSYETDDCGYLLNFSDWSPKLASHIAKQEGIDNLSEDHFHVINSLQGYYKQYGIVPLTKVLVKLLAGVFGEKANRGYLFELYPGGPMKQGSKIAGLPSPCY